jgi:subtilisin family serine protease
VADGPWVRVDMWAPGSGIMSSSPPDIYDAAYVGASGTSMAAPHVAGAFAVVDELLPAATLSAKQSRIVDTGPMITDARNKLKRHRLKLSTDVTPPQTKLTSGPASTVKSSKATFTFTTGSSGATYTCQIDNGPWKSCSAPKGATVSKGTHTFRVRGRDAAGNLDATAAVKTWRYV